MDSLDIVKKFYDETVNNEWERLDRHKVEFELSKRYMNRYIKPNDKVLDLGGGPGKYSLYLAERGCDVTLADLSPKNVDFALKKAKELGLPLKGCKQIAVIYLCLRIINMTLCYVWARCIILKVRMIERKRLGNA